MYYQNRDGAAARRPTTGHLPSARHVGFIDGLDLWRPACTLGRAMRATYEAASDRQAIVDAFLKAWAHAVASPDAVAAIATLDLVSGFRVSVAHPDDGREFYSPASEEGASPTESRRHRSGFPC